jgi:starch-binding outer membrane protein, SusD/RagB family
MDVKTIIMKKVFIVLIISSFFLACKKDFLQVEPKGTLGESQVDGGTEQLVNAAYSSLGNDHYDLPWSLWPYGDVRSGDAYKGGRDEADIQEFYFVEIFRQVRSDIGQFDAQWFQYYVAISRVNAAINNLKKVSESEFPKKNERLAEMYFLRGHWYFQLKILFKYIPYMDETVPVAEYEKISNRALTNDQLWEEIAEDFNMAVEGLPSQQSERGRVSKMAAVAYLAKTKLYQAYEQDERHNVTSINKAKLNEVVALTEMVINSGQFNLENDYANNFRLESEGGTETIFAVQHSTNDGSMFGRLNFGDVLAAPQGIGCCDFKKPSQNLVNAFKTNASGLPMITDFNNTNLDLGVNTVDPRLHHTVAMPGMPWKYSANDIYQENWNRSPDVYGFNASLKENVKRNQYIQVGPFYANPKNRIIIRLADVMLWKAEALIELGRHAEALPIINQIRTRAANSTALLTSTNGTPLADYKVEVYPVAGWTEEFAREALRFERRLELAEEGHRFFDLVRWGVADQVMNAYFEKEKTRRNYLKDGLFTKNRDEYLPIPLNQIRFSKELYVQNPGYTQ